MQPPGSHLECKCRTPVKVASASASASAQKPRRAHEKWSEARRDSSDHITSHKCTAPYKKKPYHYGLQDHQHQSRSLLPPKGVQHAPHPPSRLLHTSPRYQLCSMPAWPTVRPPAGLTQSRTQSRPPRPKQPNRNGSDDCSDDVFDSDNIRQVRRDY